MQGYVQKISTKQGHGKNGPWTAYNLNIDGEWFSCGFAKPACNEGDYVNYDSVQKGQYKNAENVSVIPRSAAPAGGDGGGNIPVNRKDVSIHYQSCRKDAIALTGVLLSNGAIKLPAKQADQFDAAVALVNELTNQFYIDLENVINDGGVSVEALIPTPGDA